ncbi:YihY/virulence factor BrkB family protein [Rhodoplanes sp. Z2-YC6860]|uniref:YihY/virulence factor BrkB family protein n=1 Tax=Rhodoplanes sp. Z2-YC6860 TaxID=674703 RepID=UPI00078C20AF|nr:YihY/virulence factor BrkB family protein [Rhodoplanes sp. Z2-YC6860]AMN39642.1 ribonuclease BN [Rhodoplanes sp. Z2-YC6860]
MRLLTLCYRVVKDAFYRFLADDGWAIASHIALSALMSLFPFLILVTALGGLLFGSAQLADQVADILLQAWPTEVATPIAGEIRRVLLGARSDLLTIGSVLAIYFASSGVESLRIGLNRAYGVIESRSWWLLRLESIGYVLIGAMGLLALSFFIVLAPLMITTAVRYAPSLHPLWSLFDSLRISAAAIVLIVALFIVHKWLPAGRRRFVTILPGIGVTLVLWLIAGELFGDYLSNFANAYVSYYAGLASVMVALVFLYTIASIFIMGGELNAAILRWREAQKAPLEATEAAES